jgi:hypothetical protein
MSEPENFIARWSRRKRDAADDADAAKLPATRGTADEGAQESKQESKQESGHAAADDRAKQDATAAQTTSPELAFDVTSLPPIDSIGAETDIRAFLAPGVPADLTRAALRRAWAADPKVRDFVGLADYDWDFNTPGAIPGFGPLEMTDELRRQVAQMVGRSLTVEDTDRAGRTATAQEERAPVEIPDESGATTSGPPIQTAQSNCGMSQDEPQNSEVGSPDVLQCGESHAATQYDSARPDDVQSIVRRPHGGALPK